MVNIEEKVELEYKRTVDDTCATFTGLLVGGSMVYSLICDNSYLDTITYVKYGSLYFGVGTIIGFGMSRIASMIERKNNNG